MEDRFTAVNNVYQNYVEKHLGFWDPLQNILTCGGTKGAVNVELARHEHLQYENIFHYELIDDQIHYDEVIKDNILCPELPIQSVNLIFADVGGDKECFDLTIEGGIKQGVTKIISSGLQKNNLGILVFLYFDGLGIEPFLDDDFGFKSKDFFSKNVEWFDEYNNTTNNQRLDGVVFYD